MEYYFVVCFLLVAIANLSVTTVVAIDNIHQNNETQNNNNNNNNNTSASTVADTNQGFCAGIPTPCEDLFPAQPCDYYCQLTLTLCERSCAAVNDRCTCQITTAAAATTATNSVLNNDQSITCAPVTTNTTTTTASCHDFTTSRDCVALQGCRWTLLPNYTIQALQNASSPQSKAYQWLLKHPDVDSMEEWRHVQLLALVSFYYALQGNETWVTREQHNYLDYTVNECQWGTRGYIPISGFDVGNACNEQGQFTSLNLYGIDPNNPSEGRAVIPPGAFVPKEVALLSALQSMRLSWLLMSNVKVHDMIPPTLGDVSALTQLTMSQNDLQGTLPTWIGTLRHLEQLVMENNYLGFTGRIPSQIGTMAQLQQVLMFNNGLNGPLPSEMGVLGQLKELWLYNNLLTGQLPFELGMARNLTVISIDDNVLSGSIPSAWGSLPALTDLRLSQNQMTGRIPSELGKASALQFLQINNNLISGRIPTELGLLGRLRRLHLNSNQLSGAVPSELGLLTMLTLLNLENNFLKGTIPPQLCLLTNLNIAIDCGTVDNGDNVNVTCPSDCLGGCGCLS